MKIDHICFAVRDLNDAIAYWSNVFGYRQMTGIVENTRQKVRVVFMCRDDSLMIKLIEPANGNEQLLASLRREGGFHHICFRCDDVNETIPTLENKGLRLLSPPAPGEAFENGNIAFMLARYGLNIELIDTDRKAAILDPVIL